MPAPIELTYKITSWYRPNQKGDHRTGAAMDMVFSPPDWPTISILDAEGSSRVSRFPDKIRNDEWFANYFFGLYLFLKYHPKLSGYIAMPDKRHDPAWHYHISKNGKFGIEYNYQGNYVSAVLMDRDAFLDYLLTNTKYRLKKLLNPQIDPEDVIYDTESEVFTSGKFVYKRAGGGNRPQNAKRMPPSPQEIMDFIGPSTIGQVLEADKEFPWWGWLVAAGAAYLIFFRGDQSPSQPQIHIHPQRFRHKW